MHLVAPSSVVAELEVKLGAAPSFRLPALERVADGVVEETEPARRVSATYLDTEDLRLTRWGVSLRHRTSDGWTVKLPRTSDGTMLVREEYLFAGDSLGVRPPKPSTSSARSSVTRLFDRESD